MGLLVREETRVQFDLELLHPSPETSRDCAVTWSAYDIIPKKKANWSAEGPAVDCKLFYCELLMKSVWYNTYKQQQHRDTPSPDQHRH